MASEVKEEERMCDSCNKSQPAQSWCNQCAQPLCQECCQAHRNMKMFKEHEVVPLSEVTEEEMKRCFKEEKCEKHRGKTLTFYCSTCVSPACSNCAILHHRGHELEEMNDVLESKRREVQSWCQKVETALPAFQDREASSHARLQRLKSTLQDREEQVQTLFSQIVTKIRVRKERVLGALRAQFEGQSQELEAQHQKDASAVESAKALVDEGRAVASLSVPSQLIGQPKKMEEEFKKLQAPEQAAVEPLPGLEVREGELGTLLACLEKVGEVVAVPFQNDRERSREPEVRERSIPENYKVASPVSRPVPRQGPAEAAASAPSVSNHASTADRRTPTPSATAGPGSAQGNSLDPQQEVSQGSLPHPSSSLPLMPRSGPLAPTPRGQSKRPGGDLESGGSPKRSCHRGSQEPESIRLSSDEDEPGSREAPTALPTHVNHSTFLSPMRTDSAPSQRMRSSSGQRPGTSAETSGARDGEDVRPEHSSSQAVNSSRDRSYVGKKSKPSSQEEEVAEEEEEEETMETEEEEEEDAEHGPGRMGSQPRDIEVMPRKVKMGGLHAVPTTPVVFANTRIKFNVKIAAPSGEESEELRFEVFAWELKAVNTRFQRPRPQISLTTSPECAQRLKETLGRFYNHGTEDLRTERIVLILEDGEVTAQVIQYFNKIDPKLLTEIID